MDIDAKRFLPNDLNAKVNTNIEIMLSLSNFEATNVKKK